jgi:hypothetical protein
MSDRLKELHRRAGELLARIRHRAQDTLQASLEQAAQIPSREVRAAEQVVLAIGRLVVDFEAMRRSSGRELQETEAAFIEQVSGLVRKLETIAGDAQVDPSRSD